MSYISEFVASISSFGRDPISNPLAMANFGGLSDFEGFSKLQRRKIQILIVEYSPEGDFNISEFGGRLTFF